MGWLEVGKTSRSFWEKNESFGQGLEDSIDAGAADTPINDLVIFTRSPPITVFH